MLKNDVLFYEPIESHTNEIGSEYGKFIQNYNYEYGYSKYLFVWHAFRFLIWAKNENGYLYFDFLFSNLWGKFQPTYEQAMERLNYMIYQFENGNLYFSWNYQKESFKI